MPLCGQLSALRRFRRDKRGSLTVMSAALLPLMIALVGLVFEFGDALLTKGRDQRVADAAAYAGAIAYKTTGSTSAMAAAALAVAKLNGSSLTAATPSCPPSSPSAPNLYICLTSSPSGDGDSAVVILISSEAATVLAPILNLIPKSSGGGSESASISAASFAEITP